VTDIAQDNGALPDRDTRRTGDRGQRPPVQATHDWTAAVRSIIAAAEADDVYELEVRSGPLRIALRRERDPNAPATALTGAPPAPSQQSPAADPSWHIVRAPLAGIWYDSPAPGATPYVAVGDSVAPGTVIGLVETMKVFNEVSSDVGGIVRQVLVARGDLIAGQAPLMAIDPAGDSTGAPVDSA
jgi:acetyl-CoA carboxylase biotin carboxyl carrier protein